MKFIDEAKIYVRAGDGGRGCVSFRREKYVPFGGPNGGDGGKGGDVIIEASASHNTLLSLKYNQHHVAKSGGHGEGSNRTGRSASDLIVPVPVGTLVMDFESGEVLADLVTEGQRFVVAHGGIGGRGNARFATATNRAPRFAQPGIPGEERWIRLELKLLADVGIIGFPNVGKSTFISRVSAARPKIADYPFTTLTPHLGVVRYGDDFQTFVLADIPGLIEGAHEGVGMGIQFLRHIERTSLLLHILDISREEADTGWHDFEVINSELASYSSDLILKPQIVAVNKTDLPVTRQKLAVTQSIFAEKGIVLYPFSAATGEGIPVLLQKIGETLENIRNRQTNHE
ncbi:GTP-binding protein [Syntrophus gentianae]|uniref:GTPase Obg n=1 Tax=Syntrophus gentianae TaxID=43775 RepID=A0A1H7ZEK5_9BACT|nr:GTPase ObgE [Syntrophus gentianae]SEM56434.1 GTP-binding protein [Syntrophus gentianae]